MNCLPVVERELRVKGRARATFWLRLGIAGGALLLWFMNLPGANPGLAAVNGFLVLFRSLSAIAFLLSLAAGLFITADSLGHERRENTLGLLFLTNLSCLDILLGKLVSQALHAFYGLLGIAPVLALTFLLGGITSGEVGRVFLACVATFLYSLNVGLCVSAFAKTSRLAFFATFALLAGQAGGPFFLSVLGLSTGNPAAPPTGCWLWISPACAFNAAFDETYHYAGNALNYWGSVAAVGASILLFFLWGWRALERQRRRFADDESGDGQPAPGRATREGGRAGWATRDLNPALWLITRHHWSSRWIYGLLGAGTAYLVYQLLQLDRLDPKQVFFFFSRWVTALYAVNAGFKLLLVLDVCRSVTDSRMSGFMELLMVSPLDNRSVADGHWQGFRVVFSRPLWLLALLNIAAAMPFFAWGTMNWQFAPALVLMALLLLVDFWSLVWIGLAISMRIRKVHRAVITTLMIALSPILLSLLFIGFESNPGSFLSSVGGIWLIMGFAGASTLGLVARNLLHSRLRDIVRASFV